MLIDIDEAENIALFEHVASQEVSRHRWYTKRLVVFERDGKLFGFHYLDPLTEMQEGQDIFEDDPVRAFPVAARKVVSTTYEAVSEC